MAKLGDIGECLCKKQILKYFGMIGQYVENLLSNGLKEKNLFVLDLQKQIKI